MPDDLTFTTEQFKNLGRTDRDQYSFGLDGNGRVIRRTSATGTFSPTGLQNAFTVKVQTVTSTAALLPTSSLTNRNAMAIENKSDSVTIYIGPDNTVTADDTATGGWEIGPNETINFDITDNIAIYAITPSGQTALVKILELS